MAGVLSPVLSPCSSCLLSYPGQPEYVREDEWDIRPSSPPSQRMPRPPNTRPGGQNVAKSIQRLRRPPVPPGKAKRQAPSQALRPVKAEEDLRPLVQVVKEMEAQGRAESFQLPDVSCTAEPSSPSPKGGSPQPIHGCKIKPKSRPPNGEGPGAPQRLCTGHSGLGGEPAGEDQGRPSFILTGVYLGCPVYINTFQSWLSLRQYTSRFFFFLAPRPSKDKN